MTTTCTETDHTPRCVENARMAIVENNLATVAAEGPNPVDWLGDSRLTPETETEAREWLANENASCLEGI